MAEDSQKIAGYRELPQEEIDYINAMKLQEQRLAEQMATIEALAAKLGDPAVARWISLARTHMETGFMFAIKAIARPTGGLGRRETPPKDNV